jgi:hypothetical protein
MQGPYVLSLVSPSGEAFPTAGCRIVQIQVSSDNRIRYDLRVITLSGKECTIVSTGHYLSAATPAPEWLLKHKAKIVDAIIRREEVLDLREAEAPSHSS